MKKYAIIMMLLMSVVLCATGCKKADEEKQNTELVTENTENETEDGLTTETEVVVDPETNITTLTEEELEWFETEFFNTEENYLVNMFLVSQYHRAEDIDLRELLYNGAYGEGTSEVSKDEVQLLKERYDIMEELDIVKVTTKELDAILQKYMGITFEQSNKVALDKLYYLEEYDAYYHAAGDTHYARFDMDYGWKKEDGSVSIEYRYEEGFGLDDSLYCVTLKEVDGTYYFVSNESVK